MSQWYIEQDGKEYGPYSSEQLKELALKGAVTPQSIVTGAGRRVRAKAVPWIFDPAIAPPASGFGTIHGSDESAVSVATHVAAASRKETSESSSEQSSKEQAPVKLATGTLKFGEKVLFVARVARTTFVPALVLTLLLIIGIAVKFIVPALVVIGVAAIYFWVTAAIVYRTTECVLTDRRIVGKRGYTAKQIVDMPLAKVDGLDVEQSPLGKLLNFGNVTVYGSGGSTIVFQGIANPNEMREQMKNRSR